MPIEPAVIINVIGANTGAAAENETTWHDNYFPSMYDSTWAPGGTVGFFLGHRPIPGNESEAESYLWVNVGEIGSWLIDNTSLSSGNVSFNSATERLKMGAVTDFDVSGTAKGILLGKDVDDYEFFAGDENGNYIHWDGTNLNIVGTLIATTGQIGTWYINDTTLSSNVVENDSGILLDAATPQIRVGPTSDGYISIIGGNTPEIISSNFNPSALIPDGFRFSAIGGIIEATDGIFRGELKTNIFTKNEINIINGDLAITTAEKLDADLSTTSTALTLKSDVFSIGDVIKIGTTQGGGGTSQELMRITGDGGDGTYTIIRDVNNTETTGDEHNKNDIAYKVGYLNSTYGIIEILGSDERILFSRTSHSDGGGGPDVLTINKRVVLGDVGTNQFGIQGYDGGDPSSLVFELGEIQNWIAG